MKSILFKHLLPSTPAKMVIVALMTFLGSTRFFILFTSVFGIFDLLKGCFSLPLFVKDSHISPLIFSFSARFISGFSSHLKNWG